MACLGRSAQKDCEGPNGDSSQAEGSLDPAAEHREGDVLHEGVHRHHQVRLVELEGFADLAGHEHGGEGGGGVVHQPGLLHVVAHPPDGGVLHQEAVRLWQLVEGVRRPVAPDVHIVHLHNSVGLMSWSAFQRPVLLARPHTLS